MESYCLQRNSLQPYLDAMSVFSLTAMSICQDTQQNVMLKSQKFTFFKNCKFTKIYELFQEQDFKASSAFLESMQIINNERRRS